MISEKVLIRVNRYTDEEVNDALDQWENDIPREVIREELGGDYFFRCPWIKCNEIVKRGWVRCPACGQRIIF